jgi:hypothetical protein
MRNLGLALVLIASVTAPHAAWAKKHVAPKRSRSKPQKHLKRSHQTSESLAPSRSDTLARAVADHKRDEQPVLTAAAPSEPRAAAAPAPEPRTPGTPARVVDSRPNEPMDPATQSNDDEVPGSRKKR